MTYVYNYAPTHHVVRGRTTSTHAHVHTGTGWNMKMGGKVSFLVVFFNS
jgi:hypothetical protein